MDKQPLESLRVSREVAENNPKIPQMQFSYAFNLMDVQRYQQAYTVLSGFRSPETPAPNADYAAILRTIGKCQLYLGKHAEAVQALTDSLRYGPGEVRTRQYLAESHLKGGNAAEAKVTLHRAFQKQNTTPPRTLSDRTDS